MTRATAEVQQSGRILTFPPPDDWDVKPLRYLFESVGGATPSKNNPAYWEGRIPWVSPKDMKSEVIVDSEDHISDSALAESRLALLPPGTVLVVVRGMILAHTIPVAITAVEATINQDMKGLFPRKGVTPEYLALVLRSVSPILFSTIEESGHGTRCLRLDLWRNILVGVPPKEVQHEIVAFVNEKAARIDALIAGKRRMIDLLHEKRQALISEAVTKGLDPDVPMKDSGIEWMGQVPATWQLVKLKYVARVQSGVTLGKKYSETPLVSRPYLRVANVQDGYLDLNEITTIDIPPDEAPRFELRPGDVLMTEGGDFDKLGRGYVWDGQIADCLHQNHVFAVRPNKNRLRSHFLSSLMTSAHGKNYFTSTSQQTTNLATTNSTKLGAFTLPVPPIREQDQILAFLADSGSRLEGATQKLRVSIDKLVEFRRTLISAAVTGKLDVLREVI